MSTLAIVLLTLCACGGGVDSTPSESAADIVGSSVAEPSNASSAIEASIDEVPTALVAIDVGDSVTPKDFLAQASQPPLFDSAQAGAGYPESALADAAVPTSVEPSAEVPNQQVEFNIAQTAQIPSAAPVQFNTVASAISTASIDFDAGEYLLPFSSGQGETIAGIVAASPGSYAGLPYDRNLGALTIQYEGGDSTERLASLELRPGSTSNRALHFWLRSPNVRNAAGVPYKARVQMNAYDAGRVRAREVRFSTRVYLSNDFNLLRARPKAFSWLAISEWWNNATWANEKFPFRVAVHITKPSATANTPLRFNTYAQTFNVNTNKWDRTLWSSTNSEIEVPVGKWVTLEYYFREGNAAEGRFYMAIVPDGEDRRMVFDIRGWTYHPSDPQPNGLSHFNPVKLYSENEVVEYVRDHGGALQMYVDDLDFRLCRQHYQNGKSPCSPNTFQ